MICNICGNKITKEENSLIFLPFGAICEECSNEIQLNKENREMKTTTRDALHLEMIEDFSNVIAKHLPNFDNNISNDTWKLLELFTEETIYQLTDPALNCECGYQH